MFNTTQFTDVSTKRQRKNGTTCYRDNFNPGVYYTSHLNGNVNRVIKKQTEIIDRMSNERRVKNIVTSYKINPVRFENQESVENSVKYFESLPTENMRLHRIQTQANKFNNKRYVANENSIRVLNEEIVVTTVKI